MDINQKITEELGVKGYRERGRRLEASYCGNI